MSYHFTKTVSTNFEQTVDRVKNQLAAEGFGILSEIDVNKKMQEKLGVDFRNYLILGACNPPYAYEALQAEPYIGTMLPCNVVVQEWEDGRVEVSAVDPVASMQAVNNPQLRATAETIRDKLNAMLERI